jgi:muconolactone delta-isomerase
MVDFSMPERLTDEFIERVPRQRQLINRYMKNKKLLSYALSLESCRMWAIFRVSSELELMQLIAELPLTPLMEVNISTLSILNTAKEDFNEICLN